MAPALRRRLRLGRPHRTGATIDQARLVWIFGYARSGSSWLARMMAEPPGWAFWNEPQVGEMLGTFYYLRYPHRRNSSFLLGDAHREVWEAGIRSLVVEGAQARHRGAEYVVIKEPHGSIGAPLLSRALPHSRMVLLIRDPRDMVASALDGQRQDGWATETLRRRGFERTTKADSDPDGFVRARSTQLMEHVSRAQEAYDNHPGPKSFVTYERLTSDPLATLGRMLQELRVDVAEEAIREAVERQRWDRIPPEERGPGKKFRKATPGGWREDLTGEQVRIVEEIAAPILNRHYAEA